MKLRELTAAEKKVISRVVEAHAMSYDTMRCRTCDVPLTWGTVEEHVLQAVFLAGQGPGHT